MCIRGFIRQHTSWVSPLSNDGPKWTDEPIMKNLFTLPDPLVLSTTADTMARMPDGLDITATTAGVGMNVPCQVRHELVLEFQVRQGGNGIVAVTISHPIKLLTVSMAVSRSLSSGHSKSSQSTD